jgi:hypothetical protein
MTESIHAERTASQPQDRVTELIEQQTAISEVLRAIANSPHDLQPIFDAILDSATRLCRADIGSLRLFEESGLFKQPIATARTNAVGPLDLSLDYRSPWWAAVGDQVRAAGCSLSVYDPR